MAWPYEVKESVILFVVARISFVLGEKRSPRLQSIAADADLKQMGSKVEPKPLDSGHSACASARSVVKETNASRLRARFATQRSLALRGSMKTPKEFSLWSKTSSVIHGLRQFDFRDQEYAEKESHAVESNEETNEGENMGKHLAVCIMVGNYRKACIDLRKLAEGGVDDMKGALNYTDRDGNSHLHSFAMSTDMDFDGDADCLLRLLFKLYPQMILTRNKRGETPIDCCSDHGMIQRIQSLQNDLEKASAMRSRAQAALRRACTKATRDVGVK